MEAKITFQIAKTIGSLTANFDALKESVRASVAKYHGLVYTDDQISEVKADLASLRAERKKIDDARKSVKKEFMNPYDQFESQVKETLAIYDDAIAEISEQVKSAEEAEKVRKKREIDEWWNRNGVQSVEGITLAQVWDERYLNKTMTAKKWQEDLTAKVRAIEADLSTISFFEPEMMNFVLPMYMRTLNLSDATQEYERFKENQRKTEEARQRAEEARLAREEQARRQSEMRMKQAEKPAAKVEEVPVKENDQPEEKTAEKPAESDVKQMYGMTFEVEGDHDSIKALCDLIRELNKKETFKYRVIEKH